MTDREHRQAIGARARAARLRAGLTTADLATARGVHARTIRDYELGNRVPRQWNLAALANALSCPVAQLLTDELVLAEIRVSPETLERVRKEGEPAAEAAAQRIAEGLKALLLAEATRPPVDLSPGARPKRRRTRAEVLAGVAEAERMRKAARGRSAAKRIE